LILFLTEDLLLEQGFLSDQGQAQRETTSWSSTQLLVMTTKQWMEVQMPATQCIQRASPNAILSGKRLFRQHSPTSN